MSIRLILAMLCLGVMSTRADTAATDQLLEKLAAIKYLQGSFVQQQYANDGSDLGQSSGRFRLLQPGYFAWDIQSPDSQLIVAGPENIWHYDRDLETVTRRPVTGNGAMSPLQVLGGKKSVLRDNYEVSSGEQEGQFVLQPHSTDAGFTTLTLQFSGTQIQSLQFTDQLGQHISIDLDDLDSDTELDSSDFDFTPPEGADLFYHDE